MKKIRNFIVKNNQIINIQNYYGIFYKSILSNRLFINKNIKQKWIIKIFYSKIRVALNMAVDNFHINRWIILKSDNAYIFGNYFKFLYKISNYKFCNINF